MKPKYIILHHSMTKDQKVVDWQAIRRYHINVKLWDDIGYHFGIENVKRDKSLHDEYEILMGRMPYTEGAHCSSNGYNHKSIGICFIGNFDTCDVPDGQWKAGLKIVRYLCLSSEISINKVIGHREAAMDGRTCPGRNFDLEKFRNDLAEA